MAFSCVSPVVSTAATILAAATAAASRAAAAASAAAAAASVSTGPADGVRSLRIRERAQAVAHAKYERLRRLAEIAEAEKIAAEAAAELSTRVQPVLGSDGQLIYPGGNTGVADAVIPRVESYTYLGF